jgi:hypothetical protein
MLRSTLVRVWAGEKRKTFWRLTTCLPFAVVTWHSCHRTLRWFAFSTASSTRTSPCPQKRSWPFLSGIRVYGASSMGALRAAETQSLGMVGVGEIFAMFLDGVLDGDDEVALVYEPHTYRNLSEPLVNLRRALDMAVACKVLNPTEKDHLVAQMKSCYFPYRSYAALQQLSPVLRDFFKQCTLPDLKRDDARELLLTVSKSVNQACAGRSLLDRNISGTLPTQPIEKAH